MTTEAMSARKCPICNKISRHAEIMSTNQIGACDLDTRPAEMMRSTMRAWVQECPNCGYVASKLTDRPKLAPEFFQTPNFVSCDGIPFASDLAKRFYKLYLVKREEKDARNAYWSALQAAWASDDADDDANAVKCRRLALEQLETLVAQAPNAVNLLVMRLDLLRRASEFDKVQELGASIKPEEELLAKVVAFELALAAKSDAARYTVADAEKAAEE